MEAEPRVCRTVYLVAILLREIEKTCKAEERTIPVVGSV